jgi:tetratricopeptide (TPR) repeat protein
VVGEFIAWWEPDFVRAISWLAGLCMATSATAQTTILRDQPHPALPFEIVNQSDPSEQTTTSPAVPNAPPAPTAPVIAPTTALAPVTPSDAKYKVSKELADKVQEFSRRREFAKAIALITEALTAESGNAELYRLRATIQCRAANTKLCLEDASKAVESDKEYAPALLFRGLVRIDAGQPMDAVSDCEATIRIWADRPQGYNCRGLANRMLGDYPHAIADFDEALIRDAKFAFAHYNKGFTYALENKLGEAIESFSVAIQINDKFDDSYAQRGKARISKGDVVGARADYAKALSLNNRNFIAAVGMQALQVGKALDALAGKN